MHTDLQLHILHKMTDIQVNLNDITSWLHRARYTRRYSVSPILYIFYPVLFLSF